MTAEECIDRRGCPDMIRMMKRLFKIVSHPFKYYDFKRNQERIVLLYAASTILNIEDPTVWDVDMLNKMLNVVLKTIHRNPNIFDKLKMVKRDLFWTRLLSRFKQLEISREETKQIVDLYNTILGSIKSENPMMSDVVIGYSLLIERFDIFA